MGKIRDYYLIKLGICGELIALRASRPAPFNEKASSRELKSMVEDNTVHYYRSKDGVRVYRLSDPFGYEQISTISPALLRHTEMVVGEQGRRYPGNVNIRAKKIRDASIVSMMVDVGLPVDGISIDQEVFFRDSTNFREVIRRARPGEPLFLTGALLRRPEGEDYHTRRELTTASGVLISPGGIYQTYAPMSDKIRFRPIIDSEIVAQVKRLSEEYGIRAEDGDSRLRAIMYPAKTSIATEIQAKQSVQSVLNPTATYKMCYLAPKDQNAEDITKMLMIKDWFFKSNSVLGLSDSGSGDGKSPDGRPIHNLLCCNMGKIEELRYQIENRTAVFVVHDWQKDLIEKVYESEIDAIVLNEVKFRGLVRYVEDKA